MVTVQKQSSPQHIPLLAECVRRYQNGEDVPTIARAVDRDKKTVYRYLSQSGARPKGTPKIVPEAKLKAIEIPEVPIFDSLGREACLHGHPWSEANRRISRDGSWTCRVCQRISARVHRQEQQHTEQGKPRLAIKTYLYAHVEPKPEKEPIAPAHWKRLVLPGYLADLRGEAAIRLVARQFAGQMCHRATAIRCHPVNVAAHGEITVIADEAMSETEYGVR